MGRDWAILFSIAKVMLWTMDKKCNKWAVEDGIGKEDMDPMKLIYWWAHHLCRQILAIKKERPEDEVIFYILDRFGLPILPWTGNVFKFSLCKGPDHGIAMLFGLKKILKGEVVDPVEGFNFDNCTVTIDSGATNMAMLNFSIATSDSIQQALASVPFSHPLWKIDLDLGCRSWVGAWDAHQQTLPQAPDPPEFEMPLLPIDHWLGRSDAPKQYQCHKCPDGVRFQNIGMWLLHCREQHAQQSSTPLPAMQHRMAPEQDEIDRDYWEDVLVCKEPGCGKSYPPILINWPCT